jgi:hypothetical protein
MSALEQERSRQVCSENSNKKPAQSGDDYNKDLKGLNNDTRLKLGKSRSQLDPFVDGSR